MEVEHIRPNRKQLLDDIPPYGAVHFLMLVDDNCGEQVAQKLGAYGRTEYAPSPQSSVLRLEVEDHSRIEEIVDKLYSGEIEGIRTIDVLDNTPVYFDRY